MTTGLSLRKDFPDLAAAAAAKKPEDRTKQDLAILDVIKVFNPEVGGKKLLD